MDTIDRFAHQQTEFDRHKFSEARGLLWQMRTGKTRAAVESACALHDVFEIGGVLVIAPNGVHRQWAEEQVPRWGEPNCVAHAWRFVNPDNEFEFEVFMSSVKQGKNLHWLCVNMEVIIRDDVRRMMARFKKAVGRAMLIIDESHHFARAKAKRTGVARGLGRAFEYRRILTGTPVENSPRQAFSQFEILRRGALGHETLETFDREFVEYGVERVSKSRFVNVITGYRNLDKMKTRMGALASVVLRSDCEDLPDIQFDRRIVEMTATQNRWWEVVKFKMLAEAEELGHNRVFAGGAALVKLQQIEGGFWKKDDKVTQDLCGDTNPKMLILFDEIEQYDGKVIVWFEYVHELEAAYAALKSAKITCGRYHGKVTPAEREQTLKQFKVREKGTRVLLAQPKAGGEGRDMSAAGKIVWYSHTPDAIVRSQANERATAMGGKGVQIVDLIAPIGEYFLRLTEKKISLAEDVSRSGLRKILESIAG